MRFCEDSFTDAFISTIGVDFVTFIQKIRTITYEGKVIKLQIWDTAGQEKFRTITSSYYKGAHGIIVVYDITDRNSFENINSWFGEIEKYASENVNKIIIGNKSDLETKRAVMKDEAQELATKLSVQFMETSAKSSNNVAEAFTTMAQEIKGKIASNARVQNRVRGEKISAGNMVVPKKSSCC
ncbi:hypothetical protein SteCoe_1810 [Stentor coeruleus]|uniref:Uncharacterized protein n=1 Tax=Stentor coeruleus TaxID=5963 RepID=A0A1R2D106_9CILI|nr:hypothetical protein SteCoe_1810 [Stentor coeruleus]